MLLFANLQHRRPPGARFTKPRQRGDRPIFFLKSHSLAISGKQYSKDRSYGIGVLDFPIYINVLFKQIPKFIRSHTFNFHFFSLQTNNILAVVLNCILNLLLSSHTNLKTLQDNQMQSLALFHHLNSSL